MNPEPYYHDPVSNITVFCGLAEQILPFVGRHDLLLVDAPYGISADKNLRANKKHGNAIAPSRDYGIGEWDDCPPPKWMMDQAIAATDWQIVFGGNYFHLPPSRCWLVWDKDNGNNGYADCELAWTNFDKAVRMFRWKWHGMLQEDMANKEFRWHPTQKPVAVMRWAIKQAPAECRSLIDCYMGVGTSLVAAKEMGLSAVGIEREEKYCNIAVERLSQAVLFSAPPEKIDDPVLFGTSSP